MIGIAHIKSMPRLAPAPAPILRGSNRDWDSSPKDQRRTAMTAFSTPCTVLTVTSTGAIEIEHLDSLEDARQYISDFPGDAV